METSDGKTGESRWVDAVHVFTERAVPSEHRTTLLHLLRQLRGRAVMHNGYLLGMVWEDVHNPDRVVSCESWQSVNRWNEFRVDPQNQRIIRQIEDLLSGPPVVRIFTDAHGQSFGPTPPEARTVDWGLY